MGKNRNSYEVIEGEIEDCLSLHAETMANKNSFQSDEYERIMKEIAQKMETIIARIH